MPLHESKSRCSFLFFAVSVVSLIAICNSSVGQSVSPEVLGRVKAATTFIRTDVGEGTGFLIQRSGSKGIVATAAHVVATERVIRPTVDVFFSSGTDTEYSFKGKVLALDVGRDIGFLEITSSNLPEPLYLAPDATLTETMDVVVAGFPFGGQISVGTQNPSLTISKGSISSIKQSATDSVTLLQLDVSVNPGNSGGPVLNSQGEVIGVVSAKIDGTQLGFAIPVATIYRDFMGDSTDLSGDLFTKSEKKQCTVRGRLVDPLKRVESVTLLIGSIATLPSVDFRANKEWPKLPSKAEFKCDLRGDSFDVQFSLPTNDITLDEAVGQLVCSRVDGTIAYSAPIVIQALISKKDLPPERSRPSPRTTEPEKDKRSADNNSDGPSRNDPSTALTGRVYAINGIVHPEKSRLSTAGKKGALSEPVPMGNLTFQRVLVPKDRFSPSLLWNETGDKLVTLGNNITVIDYPSATHVELYSVPRPPTDCENWNGYLLVTGSYGQVWQLDPTSMKYKSSIGFSRPIESHLSQSSQLLLSPTDCDPRELYLWDESAAKIIPLDLTDGGRFSGPSELCVAHKGKYVFTWLENQLNRFSLAGNKLTFEESIATRFSDTATPKFMNNCDDQSVGLIARQASEGSITSHLEVYASKRLATHYSVEISDYITCAVRDTSRHRYVFGGKDGLWSWAPNKLEATKMPFPSSATSVMAMALNPNKRTLAILCGATGHGNLYWVDLTNSDLANN